MKIFSFKTLIYSSKNKINWQKAQEILKKGGVNFKIYISEEPPLVCCGAKIDIRDVFNSKKIDKNIYQILVDRNLREKAENLLKIEGII